MRSVGIDLHKKSITVCVVNKKRQILLRRRLELRRHGGDPELLRRAGAVRGGGRGHRQLRMAGAVDRAGSASRVAGLSEEAAGDGRERPQE